jgi:tryptophan-rich sensory protein
MELDLQMPFWYPGDEALLVFNQLWVPVFGIFALVSMILSYKVIKEGWPKYLLLPFITNIIGVVLFVVVLETDVIVLGGFFVVLLMLVGTVVQIVGLWSRSLTLALLCIPYLIWLIIMNVFYIELIRVNII